MADNVSTEFTAMDAVFFLSRATAPLAVAYLGRRSRAILLSQIMSEARLIKGEPPLYLWLA